LIIIAVFKKRYRAYALLVLRSGGFWVDSGSFTNVTEAKTLTPGLCREFFTCAVDNGNCTEFERVARLIVDEWVHRSYDSRTCFNPFSII